MSLGTVVIVGGIGGHSLDVSAASYPWPRVRIWVNTPAILAGGWLWLQLAPDGLAPASTWFPRLDPGAPLPDYYGVLGSELRALGWQVVSPALDWRGTVASDGRRLASLVADLASAGPVRIVAHSRGGLVTRVAIRLLEESGQLPAVSGVVGLGVPHLGSLAAAQMLAGWQETVLQVLRILQVKNLVAPVFPSPDWFQSVVTSWPGVYELLPRPGSRWMPPDQVEALYDASAYRGCPAAVSQPWLNAARSWWESAPSVPSEVPWIDVVGYGRDTPDRLTASPLNVPRSMALSASGDGVVTEASARQPSRVTVRVPVAHAALPYDGRVLAAIGAALSGSITADVTLS